MVIRTSPLSKIPRVVDLLVAFLFLSTSPFMSVNICLIHWGAPILGAYIYNCMSSGTDLLIIMECPSLSLVAVLMEKAMAPHSSTLAWKIPWMEKPARLQSMGSLGVGHNWATSLSLFTCMHWRRKWQPTPVFLPRESQGWGSLVGCRLWGCTESDTTEATQQQQQQQQSLS